MCRDVSVIARDLPLTLDWESARYTPPAERRAVPALQRARVQDAAREAAAARDAAAGRAPTRCSKARYETFTSVTIRPSSRASRRALDEAAARGRVAVAMRGDAIAVSAGDGTAFAFLRVGAANPRRRGRSVRAVVGDRAAARRVRRQDGSSARSGCRVRTFGDDAMIAAHLLNPSRTFADVAEAASEMLERVLPDECGRRRGRGGPARAQGARRARARNQLALYADVEVPLAPVLAEMERAGIALDPEALREISAEVDAAVERLQAEIFAFAGEEFNIGSPQQLGACCSTSWGCRPEGRTRPAGRPASKCCKGSRRDSPSRPKCWNGARSPNSRTPTST